jgi:hypothetical protein
MNSKIISHVSISILLLYIIFNYCLYSSVNADSKLSYMPSETDIALSSITPQLSENAKTLLCRQQITFDVTCVFVSTMDSPSVRIGHPRPFTPP